jgi:hypothetical protein
MSNALLTTCVAGAIMACEYAVQSGFLNWYAAAVIVCILGYIIARVLTARSRAGRNVK